MMCGALLALASAGALAAVAAEGSAEFGTLAAGLVQARDLIGIDPVAARHMIARLRAEAVRLGDPAARLSLDEIDCRFLGDNDADAAVRVADAGLAATAGANGSQARAASLRLRACRAGALIEAGRADEGLGEIDEVLRQSSSSPPDAANALARLERGVYRSRTGMLEDGQADLLAACAALAQLELARDKDLCLGHLANHYKRVGDGDEALRLLEELVDQARRRGALVDESVYLFGIAQVWHDRKAWAQARDFYERAERVSAVLHDDAGVSYAEAGIGGVLLDMGHAAEARAHLEGALRMLPENEDPKQAIRTRLKLAQIDIALGETARAATALAELEQPILGFRDDVLRAAWLRADTQLQASRRNWEQAYRSLDAWREIDARQQAQRLSDYSARVRMRFNRDRDLAQLRNARESERQAEQQSELRGLVLVLALALILFALAFAATKIREARRSHLLSLTDELTGLGNRRAIMHFLEIACRDAVRESRALSILIIDLDRFKTINDTRGHAAGDAVLRRLGQVFASALRAHDRLGRFGGEEFLAVLPDTEPELALTIAERIRQRSAETSIPAGPDELSVSVSIGIASVPRDAVQASSLLVLADRALYAAKARGRDRTVLASQVAMSPPAEHGAGPTAPAAAIRLTGATPADSAA